jgi:hypothetical protein
MERAARIDAAVGEAARKRRAAALEALRWSWGSTQRLGLDDDLGWWAGCRDGRRGRVTAGCAAGPHAQLTRVRGLVPPLARADPGTLRRVRDALALLAGGGHAR